MFYHIARILRAKQPRLFILENVKGLLNHAGGRTFKTIIATIEKLGYRVEWQVRNSKHYGVAQHRERVYIVGHHRNDRRSEILPLARASCTDDQAHQSQTGSGIQTLYDCGYPNGRIIGTEGISPALVASDVQILAVTNASAREFKWHSDRSPTLVAADGKVPKIVGYTCSECAKLGEQAEDVYCHIRKLTPIECERLQGFQDNHTASISDSQRYKCLGNAVTTNVVEAVIKKIFAPRDNSTCMLLRPSAPGRSRGNRPSSDDTRATRLAIEN
jgi:DNA (cytosine-5)-methyltransferase 1